MDAIIIGGGTTILTAGAQGPAGPAGPTGPSGGMVASYTAGAILGGHRGVKLDAAGNAQYASNDDAASLAGFVGVTLGAATMGDTVQVALIGLVEEPSWSWTAGLPVFLGVNGLLTQTAPVFPALQVVVGVAPTTTSLFIFPRDRVVLS